MAACTTSRAAKASAPASSLPSGRGATKEGEVAEHPVQLREQGARPGRAHRHLEPEQALDGKHNAQLGGERREPVVTVREHQQLPVVACLEQLLGPAVQEAHHRLAGDDALTLDAEPELQRAVRGGVVGSEVE